MEAIVAEAKGIGLRVFVHGTPGSLAVEAIEAGVDGLVHVPFGDLDVESLVQTVGKQPISATAGLLRPFPDPQGNLRTPYGTWDEQRERAEERQSEDEARPPDPSNRYGRVADLLKQTHELAENRQDHVALGSQGQAGGRPGVE